MAYQNFTNLTDWQYDTSIKKIKHNTGTARSTVQALYSEIQNEVDELVQMDDTVPIKYNTPTEYELINGWTFSADSDVGYLYGGSIKVNQTDDMWANFYTLGTLESGAVVYWLQNGAAVAAHPGYADGHIDQLIKTRSAGADVDTRYVTALVRTWTDSYTHNKLQAPTTGGRNPVAIETANDLNNQTSSGTVAGWTDVTTTFGSPTADWDQDGTSENYTVTVDCAGRSLAQVYERLKYVTRVGETTTLNGTQGQFYTRASGAFTEVKVAPFGTYAGGKFFGAQGVLLSNYVAGEINNIILTDNTGAVKQAPTAISVGVNNVVSGDKVFMARSDYGNFTATAATDLLTETAHGLLPDDIIQVSTTGTLPAGLAAATNYYVIASGLTANDWKVSATQGGSAVDITTTGTGTHSWTCPLKVRKDQFTFNLAGSDSTHIVVNETVGNDIPTTGVVRIGDTRYAYSALDRTLKKFTVAATPLGETNGANTYCPIIDEQVSGTSVSKALTYVADFSVVARVRKYAAGAGNSILPFENTGTVINTGLTVSAIRTVDSVAT